MYIQLDVFHELLNISYAHQNNQPNIKIFLFLFIFKNILFWFVTSIKLFKSKFSVKSIKIYTECPFTSVFQTVHLLVIIVPGRLAL